MAVQFLAEEFVNVFLVVFHGVRGNVQAFGYFLIVFVFQDKLANGAVLFGQLFDGFEKPVEMFELFFGKGDVADGRAFLVLEGVEVVLLDFYALQDVECLPLHDGVQECPHGGEVGESLGVFPKGDERVLGQHFAGAVVVEKVFGVGDEVGKIGRMYLIETQDCPVG